MSKALLLALMLLTFNLSPLSFGNEAQAKEERKNIFVDFSLRKISTGLTPILHYGESECDLIEEGGGMYKSESPVLSSSLSAGYSISYDGNNTITIGTDSLILNPLYNYLCINENNEVLYGSYGATISNPGATAATQRIWLSNDDVEFYSNDEWGRPCKNALAYIKDGQYQILITDNCRNSVDSKDYYFGDIPAEAYSCHFLRLSNNNRVVYEDIEVSFRQYGICYVRETKENISTMTAPKADAYILGLVVEAYLTYGKLSSNGSDSETVSNLYKTWFKDKSATIEELKTQKIIDYDANGFKGGEYHPEVLKNTEFSVNEKWNAMCSQAGIDPTTGEKRSILSFTDFASRNWSIIALVCTAGMVLLFGIISMFIKNRFRTEG